MASYLIILCKKLILLLSLYMNIVSTTARYAIISRLVQTSKGKLADLLELLSSLVLGSNMLLALELTLHDVYLTPSAK